MNGKTVPIVITVAGLIIIGIIWLQRRFLMGVVWDQVSEYRIQKLHPAIQDKVRQFLNLAKQKGIFLRVTDGTRTFAEQQSLYNKGRTEAGSIVTYALPGFSAHNYGLAVDVVPIVDGNAIYNDKALYKQIADIGKSLGFKWGGDPDFKGGFDQPHFEMLFGYNIAQLKKMYESGQTKNGFVAI